MDVEYLNTTIQGGDIVNMDDDTRDNLITILDRVLATGPRRGGPTKDMILSLQRILPGTGRLC